MLDELTASIDSCLPCAPYTRRFTGNQVAFVLTGFTDQYVPRPYSWSLETGKFTPDDQLFKNGYEAFWSETLWQTGEVIWPQHDERFSSRFDAQELLYPPPNTLYIYDPREGTSFPFHHLPNRAPSDPRFIQGGERVLYSVYEDVSQTYQWFVVERDGTIASDVVLPDFNTNAYNINIYGTSDGFIYDSDSPTTNLMVVNTRIGGSKSELLWSSTDLWTVSHVQSVIDVSQLSAWKRLD